MQKFFKYSLFFTALFCVESFYAQSKERQKDTIDTQTVNVVKPYTPTVSDAFKIKETPSLDDATTSTKKDVKYNIFSIPVASTFTPAKGKAATVDKTQQTTKLYNNYASLGVGTYTSILGEVYLNYPLSNNQNLGAYLGHHSSQGGIEDLLLDDDFYKSDLKLNYKQQERYLSWGVDGGFGLYTYNWYGLPQPLYDQNTADGLDVNHTFYNAYVGGTLSMEDAIVDNVEVTFRRFADNQESGENHFTATSVINVPIQREWLKTKVTIDYLGGQFDRNYYSSDAIDYGNFNIGLAPSYELVRDDLTLNLGVELVYLNDTEASESDVFIYPKVTASYILVDELLVAYGAVEGELNQNSYYSFATENPFVSPTLFITPTDQQYDISLGVKGKLSNSISYNVGGSYRSEQAKAMFKSNSVLNVTNIEEDYQYANSFGVVYDDVTTLSLKGELNVNVNSNLKLAAKAEYLSYDTDSQSEAWNLPNIKGALLMDYQIDEHWFAGANLFYVGERKAEFVNEDIMGTPSYETLTLDSFFDANLHGGYHINDRWSVFVKGNNIFNQDYNRWLNYRVQGIQFLAGATYQFDF